MSLFRGQRDWGLDDRGDPWHIRAACAGQDTEMFFSKNHYVIMQALEFCGRCPVQNDCLKLALELGEHGIWGGLTEEQRRAVEQREMVAQAALNRVKQREMVAQGAANRVKDRCPAGHEYVRENTYWKADGARVCRTCHLARQRQRRLERKESEDCG